MFSLSLKSDVDIAQVSSEQSTSFQRFLSVAGIAFATSSALLNVTGCSNESNSANVLPQSSASSKSVNNDEKAKLEAIIKHSRETQRRLQENEIRALQEEQDMLKKEVDRLKKQQHNQNESRGRVDL